MIDMTIYGTPSSTYEYMKTIVKRQARKAGIQLQLHEVNDTGIFIKENILSIPAFKINDALITRNGGGLNEFIREVNYFLLKQENFGEMKKILVPIDFSETSENAIDYAQKLSARINGVIKLLHVYHPAPAEANELSIVNPKEAQVSKDRLEAYAAKLNEVWIGEDADKTMIDAEFREGLAADEILDVSKQNDNGIIVMGSTGGTDTFKKIFGSVSTKVARFAECPVVLVPPGSGFVTGGSMAYLSEDPELDAAMVPKVVEMAKALDADLHIIHFGKENGYSQEKVIDMWQQFYPAGRINMHFLEGDPDLEKIEEISGAAGVNVMSMSTRQRSILGQLFHSSFTKRMAINTKWPLIIFHQS